MLSKKQRLGRKEFSHYFKIGKRYHLPELTIIYSPTPTLLAAVVISKKVAKSAVRRNTIKRRIMARLARLQKETALTGVFIVIVKPAFNSLTRAAADELVYKSIAQLAQST